GKQKSDHIRKHGREIIRTTFHEQVLITKYYEEYLK
ncbi:MAG: hypothetical protein JWQ57_3645, partial [Mucilaginibacter sp.]|nr:hypothetical protein [Mucilaginibacter sp.]